MQGHKKMALIIYHLLTTLLVPVAGTVCPNQHSFSCTEQDTELPDNTIGRACVCVFADCIPKANPCPTIDNIVFKDPTFTFITRNLFLNYSRINSIDIQSSSVDYIADMAFEGQQNLKMLRIEGNKIQFEAGAFRSMENLEILQFQPKNFALTRELFTGLGSTLENLDLGTGMVRKLNNNTFDQFINLKTLSLANNHLGTIQQRWFFRLAQLEELNLGGNNIQSIPSSVFNYQTNLKKLYIPENEITALEEGCFDGLGFLEELVLSGNQIQYMDNLLTGLANLTKLVMNDNLLQTTKKENFAGLASLQSLSLSGNSIASISAGSFDSLPKLESLDLSQNLLPNLREYYFEDLQTVSTINLGYNKINEIGRNTFTSLTNLTYLFLENNQLNTFSFMDFSDKHNLQRLSLQNNTITSVSFSTIVQPPQLLNLKILWLENNRLPTFPSLIFDYAPQLAIGRNSLQLTQNPLSCDCNIKDLSESTRNIVLDAQISSNCAQPICSAPTAIFVQENVIVPVGEEVSLICNVTGQPNPLVSWMMNDVVIEGTYNTFTGISQINFDKVSKSNYGNYTCTVRNIYGSSNITMNLIEKKVKYQDAGGENDQDVVKGKNEANCHMPSYMIFGNLVLLTAIVRNY
ncbi:leucine-rich repeat-containing protein 15-like [Anneissia japonica]|uniref:leucine-rich repeat-containing protein 15-like n=1 Tax=Anneissia japonica TaxID=1529436 RepID=UPI001425A106|nr:leucine-rich repeat-containing protein 15-like [Anneissia japonica]